MLKSSSWTARIQMLRSSVRFLLSPERTEELFKIDQLFLNSSGATRDAMRAYADAVMSLPGMRDSYEQRYLPQPADLGALLELPRGTLGRVFAEHMRAHSLDVVFYPKVDVVDEITYLSMRARQTHDILHVLTGFGTSVQDEIGLQAFGAALINSPMSVGIIGGGLMRASVLEPWMQQAYLESTIRGYAMGQAAQPLVFAYRYEDNWARPLDDLRCELGIVPVVPMAKAG
jgi:ubiquinone biosynthesis protein Coq4